MLQLQWNGYGAHHVDYHQLPNGLWLVAMDGRESCAMSHARINYRCSTEPPSEDASEECRAFWADPSAFQEAAASFRDVQLERLQDGFGIEFADVEVEDEEMEPAAV